MYIERYMHIHVYIYIYICIQYVCVCFIEATGTAGPSATPAAAFRANYYTFLLFYNSTTCLDCLQ